MSSNAPTDTIYALSTPPGVAALAVVRLSGPDTRAALTALGVRDLSPRVATLAKLYDDPISRLSDDPKNRLSDYRLIGSSGHRVIGSSDHRPLLDHALVTFFEGPRSFTGEDTAEISLHGGRAVVAGVMSALATLPGLRLADPGEFTRRAFLNGKIDLTEAEAVADLIHAETALQRIQALGQLNGRLKDLYDGWRTDIIRASAYIEAHLDFPDEDLPADVMSPVRPAIQKLHDDIAAHLNDGKRGERIRDGVRVVILGAPNAGKSSLLNAIVKRDAAIVSEHAGTTRDVIDVHLDLDGVAVTLTDTAGLRANALGDSAPDTIERIGITRATERAREADLKLILIDGTGGSAVDDETRAMMDDASIIVWTKRDQIAPVDIHKLSSLFPHHQTHVISVKTGDGVDALMTALSRTVHDIVGQAGEGASITRDRHRVALISAHDALGTVLGADDLPPELMAEELRGAVNALGRITGRVDVEDLLDVIFRDFCIGK